VNNPGEEATAAIQTFHDKTLHVLNSVRTHTRILLCLTNTIFQAGLAKLQFVGHAISVWGPSRPDSSQYEVRLDDRLVSTDEFGTVSNESALLYSVRGLAPGLPHTLQIANGPLEPQRPWLRIDRFVIESGTDGGDNIKPRTIDDSDNDIHYVVNKKQKWLEQTGDRSVYHDGTFQ